MCRLGGVLWMRCDIETVSLIKFTFDNVWFGQGVVGRGVVWTWCNLDDVHFEQDVVGQNVPWKLCN